MESQKESSYKQYYQQFVENQNRLHSMYDKAAQQDTLKDHTREELVARGVEEQRQRQMREYQDSIQRTNDIIQDRRAPRSSSV
jgi:predicted HAD superfamily Cof-like phosphohydrolase